MNEGRSGFIEGKCDKCGKPTFSKGTVAKYKCHGKPRELAREEKGNA